jgi:histidyl-tRNA synthetase
MLSDTLETVGIPRGDYLIRVNNRKVLNGVLETMGLAEDDPKRDDVLRTIDKFDKIGEAGVRELLGEGRLDSSGAFIPGVGLNSPQSDLVLSFVQSFSIVQSKLAQEASNAISEGHNERAQQLDQARYSVSPEFIQDSEYVFNAELYDIWNTRLFRHLREITGRSSIGLEGVGELEAISQFIVAQGYGPDRIQIDPSVVRGLGYYTGPVYEAELTFEILDEKGRKRQFGSVAGGGRYDGLVKRFTGQEVPATGVSIGVDRLLAALREKGRLTTTPTGPVVVTVMDRDRMADYQAMVTELRNAGIRAEVYLGNPKNFGNQLKYADKRNAPVAIIEGGDEKAKGVIQIKDLILGAKIAESATLEEWKERPSQFEVPRGDLVAKVREIIESQG